MNLVKVFKQSKELKKTIVALSKKHQIPLKFICREVNIDYRHFMDTYINSNNVTHFDITEGQVYRILEILGIEARMQFVIKTDYNAIETQQQLKEKHGYEHWTDLTKKEEKGLSSSTKTVDTIFD